MTRQMSSLPHHQPQSSNQIPWIAIGPNQLPQVYWLTCLIKTEFSDQDQTIVKIDNTNVHKRWPQGMDTQLFLIYITVSTYHLMVNSISISHLYFFQRLLSRILRKWLCLRWHIIPQSLFHPTTQQNKLHHCEPLALRQIEMKFWQL